VIAYCRTCHELTIVRPQIGARCSFCDEIVVTECVSCHEAVYPKRRGRPASRCQKCQPLRKKAAA